MEEHQSKNYNYFIYARKSSEAEDRQVQSIDDQINRLKELAKTFSLNIKQIFTESRSAKTPYNRPIFTEMMGKIEKGEANGILCWETNRLSRNPIESGQLSWYLQRGIIKCIQTIDRKFLSDDNVVVFNIESSIANQYIIDLRKNCMRGMVGKAERGWLPSLPPIGYLNDKQTGEIVSDPLRLPLIKKIWELALTGSYSTQTIRKIANSDWGFKTRKFKKHGDNPLSNALIYKILANRFYTGTFEFGGKLYQGKHEPIIAIEEFDRVQELMGRTSKAKPKTNNFAYTGMIKCQNCGSMYTAEEKFKFIKSSGKFKSYIYYRCTRKVKSKIQKCVGQKPLTLNDLESQFKSEIASYTISPEFYSWAKSILKEQKLTRTLQTSKILESLQKNLEDSTKELSNLTRMRYKEMIDDEIYTSEQNKLKNEIIHLKHQIKDLWDNGNSVTNNMEMLFEFISKTLSNFESLNNFEKKEVVSFLGSNYSILNKKLYFTRAEWLKPLKENYMGLQDELTRIEPTKRIDNIEQNTNLVSIYQRWRACIENIRTILITNYYDKPFNIPNIKLLGRPPNDSNESNTLPAPT